MTRLELFRLKSMWGNFQFDYALSMARGFSGGIISMWDPLAFVKENIWSENNFVIVKGRWSEEDMVIYMVNIYAPQSRQDKLALWNKLSDFMNNNVGEYIMLGDWNAVRVASERSGTDFCAIDASNFNDFINGNMLHEIPLGGLHYTWRVWFFLRGYSDHSPIMLFQDNLDYGPTYFKLFDSWFERPNFDDMVKQEWAIITSSGAQHITAKLRALKGKLKCWITQSRKEEKAHVKVLIDNINGLDTLIDSGHASEVQIDTRNTLFQAKEDICKFEALDSLQKARVKWDIEGDENS
ncbi:uncharacterized protein [Rutidosis leptorrhynchoides]|uniref:uncharacterized protein n=1 Tax=Rutidosis leptorrhynchoides TaxID=125765 RepID=UPI003A99BD85